ncbi:hypothetical protein DAPPUDRAFT_320179 [Daphnia pulex]|uniref:Uncharacterized protein n=1 Tax=Daphnia pulex TaxID=6669 RepID=E9GP33_DAPPU|nr:hypothetical protein DAPPUDRAFT_320179 [Daphnia pulex]|eukprot:EFX78572.1 hypothetical protein DAPPUDRAFT_320179 [Daphnia pulex]
MFTNLSDVIGKKNTQFVLYSIRMLQETYLFLLVTIEEPSTSQEDTLSNTADGDGLEPELDASGTETEICNITEPTATSDSQLVWEAGILLVLRQKFYLPFEALLFVSDAIHDNYQKSVTTGYTKGIADTRSNWLTIFPTNVCNHQSSTSAHSLPVRNAMEKISQQLCPSL